MKRNKFFLLVMIGVLAVTAAGCGLIPGKAKHVGKMKPKENVREVATDKDNVELYSIDLCIAAENEDHVYNASYPRYKDKINAKTHEVDRLFFEPKRPEVISRDDFNIFLEHYEKHKDDQREDDPFLYELSIDYYDESGENQRLYLYEYGKEFPEDLGPVVEKFNELCGEDVFPQPETIVELSPEFIYENFGVTDKDYSPEEINAMLTGGSYHFFSDFVGKSTSNIDSIMAGYYNDLENAKIEDLYAKELMNSNVVNDEEHFEFAGKFAKSLGDDWEVDEYIYDSDQVRVKKHGTEEYFVIGTGYYAKENAINKYGNLEVNYIIGDGGFGYSNQFVYNKTGDYTIQEFRNCEGFADIVKAFSETE